MPGSVGCLRGRQHRAPVDRRRRSGLRRQRDRCRGRRAVLRTHGTRARRPGRRRRRGAPHPVDQPHHDRDARDAASDEQRLGRPRGRPVPRCRLDHGRRRRRDGHAGTPVVAALVPPGHGRGRVDRGGRLGPPPGCRADHDRPSSRTAARGTRGCDAVGMGLGRARDPAMERRRRHGLRPSARPPPDARRRVCGRGGRIRRRRDPGRPVRHRGDGGDAVGPAPDRRRGAGHRDGRTRGGWSGRRRPRRPGPSSARAAGHRMAVRWAPGRDARCPPARDARSARRALVADETETFTKGLHHHGRVRPSHRTTVQRRRLHRRKADVDAVVVGQGQSRRLRRTDGLPDPVGRMA